jgi:hypothetical protein
LQHTFCFPIRGFQKRLSVNSFKTTPDLLFSLAAFLKYVPTRIMASSTRFCRAAHLITRTAGIRNFRAVTDRIRRVPPTTHIDSRHTFTDFQPMRHHSWCCRPSTTQQVDVPGSHQVPVHTARRNVLSGWVRVARSDTHVSRRRADLAVGT